MPSEPNSGYVALTAEIRGRAFHCQLLARPHVSRSGDEQLPANRTLFLLNVPLQLSEDDLRSAFAFKDEEVVVHLSSQASESGAASTAHIVFTQPASLKRVLTSNKPLQLPTATCKPSSAAHPPKREELQRNVSSFMQAYEDAERKRETEEDAKHNQIDADGFVLVARKRTGRSTATEDATGATVGVAGSSAAMASADGLIEPKKKRKKPKDMADFYHFQQHERKREQLVKLREQFEQDRQRIARMRADRKFKPQGY